MKPSAIEIFQQLPQFQHLTEEKVNAFISHVNSYEPERLLDFHIPRLGGIGGSEIGEVIGEFMDNRSRFGCRRTVVQSKLLLEFPEKPTYHTLRGNINEPVIRRFFREQSGGDAQDEILQQLGERRHSKFSWLVGRPDELIYIGNKLYLVDYKCPSPGFESDYDRDGVPFGYQAQLHHYDMLLQDNGIEVDGILLVAMDAVKPGVLEIYEVEKRPALYEAIADIGNETWNDFVLTGILPPWPPFEAKPETLDPDLHKDITSLMDELALVNSMDSELKKRQESIKNNLGILVPKSGINTTSAHGVMNLGFNSGLSEEVLLARSNALGIDTDNSRFRVGEPSIEVMRGLMDELHIKPEDYMEEMISEAKMKSILDQMNIPESKYFEFKGYKLEEIKNELVSLGEPEEVFITTTPKLSMSRTKALAEKVSEYKANANRALEAYAPHVEIEVAPEETLVETPQEPLPEAAKPEQEVKQDVVEENTSAPAELPEVETMPEQNDEQAPKRSLKF